MIKEFKNTANLPEPNSYEATELVKQAMISLPAKIKSILISVNGPSSFPPTPPSTTTPPSPPEPANDRGEFVVLDAFMDDILGLGPEPVPDEPTDRGEFPALDAFMDEIFQMNNDDLVFVKCAYKIAFKLQRENFKPKAFSHPKGCTLFKILPIHSLQLRFVHFDKNAFATFLNSFASQFHEKSRKDYYKLKPNSTQAAQFDLAKYSWNVFNFSQFGWRTLEEFEKSGYNGSFQTDGYSICFAFDYADKEALARVAAASATTATAPSTSATNTATAPSTSAATIASAPSTSSAKKTSKAKKKPAKDAAKKTGTAETNTAKDAADALQKRVSSLNVSSHCRVFGLDPGKNDIFRAVSNTGQQRSLSSVEFYHWALHHRMTDRRQVLCLSFLVTSLINILFNLSIYLDCAERKGLFLESWSCLESLLFPLPRLHHVLNFKSIASKSPACFILSTSLNNLYSHIRRYMFAKYELFTGYYDLSFRMMLMRQYSGRQKAYEQAVKHFIGGSKKYGPDRPTPKQKNRSSTKHGKVRKKCYQKPEPDDPGPNQRTIIAFGDAKMAWNMPGTLSMSHRKLKHYMALASKRLGRFTAADGVDPSLIGQLKFEVIEIPEYMTSQASHDQQSFDESVHSHSLTITPLCNNRSPLVSFKTMQSTEPSWMHAKTRDWSEAKTTTQG